MSKILYNSEPESEEEKEQPIKQAPEQPQNIKIKIPKQDNIYQEKPLKKPSKTVKKQQEWDEYINDNLEEYKKKEYNKQPKNFKCEYCNQEFVREYHLNRHLNEQRCIVKRNEDIKREYELKQLEKQIEEKLKKKELRQQKKKLMEQNNYKVEEEKPKRKQYTRKPKEEIKQVEEEYKPQPIQQPKPIRTQPKYIINF